MISAPNHQSGFRHPLREDIECFNHQLQPLIGAPLSKSENAVLWVATAREVGKLWAPGQDSVRPKVDIIASVFVVEDFSIPRHENGD
jgi:hypothetical protein